MKKFQRTLQVLGIILFSFSISSCDKKDDNNDIPEQKAKLVLAKSDVTIKKGTHASVLVKESDGNFTAESSNKSVVTVKIVDKTILIQGVSVGKAIVTVKDKSNTKKVNVTVVGEGALKLGATFVSVQEGKTAEVTIDSHSEEPNYVFSYSVEDIVEAKVQEETIIITAKAKGKTIITVTDKGFNPAKTAEISVKVFKDEPFSIEPSVVQTIAIDESFTYKIKGGSGKYRVLYAEGSPADVVTFKVNEEENTITLTGAKEGHTSLNVEDENTHKKAGLAVDVIAEKTLILESGADNIGLTESETKNVTLVKYHSATPNYTITYSEPNVVTVEPVDNEVFKFTALNKGQVTVTLTDNGFATPQSKDISVSVEEADSPFEIGLKGQIYLKDGASPLSGDIVCPAAGLIITSSSVGARNPFVRNSNITSIDCNNVEYIQTYGFYKCEGLTKVILRKVKSIDAAFYTNPKLEEIYCYMENPKTIEVKGKDKMFKNCPKDKIKLYVPAGKVEAYKNSPWGSLFKPENIQEMP